MSISINMVYGLMVEAERMRRKKKKKIRTHTHTHLAVVAILQLKRAMCSTVKTPINTFYLYIESYSLVFIFNQRHFFLSPPLSLSSVYKQSIKPLCSAITTFSSLHVYTIICLVGQSDAQCLFIIYYYYHHFLLIDNAFHALNVH